jgi:type IV pilus assembly protein PilA
MLRKFGQISRNNQGGFTLVELMIVVAIIGILAAIAIPQFAAYRIRGFNSSALSDVKNIQTAESAYFADNQLYAITGAATALGTPAAGVAQTGPGTVALPTFLSQWIGGVARNMNIGLGNQVTAVANNNILLATAYNAGGKHLQGDSIYAVDSDSTAVYQNSLLAQAAVNQVLLAATIAGAAITTNEFTTAAQVTAGWVGK